MRRTGLRRRFVKGKSERRFTQNSNETAPIADIAPFTYGDEVRMIDGEYESRTGAVVGMNDPVTPSIFTIKLGNGSDAEIPLEFLERLPD